MKDVIALMRAPLDKRGIINNASLVNEQIKALEDAGYRIVTPPVFPRNWRNGGASIKWSHEFKAAPRITEEGK